MPTHTKGDSTTKQLIISLVLAVIVVVVLGYLLFSLPNLPVLGSSGYPEAVEQVDQPEEVLEFLQAHNRAIVKVGYTLHWLIFFMFVLALQITIPHVLTRIAERRRRARTLDT